MDIYVYINFLIFYFCLIFYHDFVLYIDFTNVTATNTAPDNVIN